MRNLLRRESQLMREVRKSHEEFLILPGVETSKGAEELTNRDYAEIAYLASRGPFKGTNVGRDCLLSPVKNILKTTSLYTPTFAFFYLNNLISSPLVNATGAMIAGGAISSYYLITNPEVRFRLGLYQDLAVDSAKKFGRSFLNNFKPKNLEESIEAEAEVA